VRAALLIERVEHARHRTQVAAFAGEEVDRAVFYPEDERFLVERDLTATHYRAVEG